MKRVGGILILLGGLVLGLALGALILFSSGRLGQPTQRILPPTIGAQLANFNLPALDGSRLELADLRGKAVMVNFWATWCPPCREEMPLLEALSEHYADRLVIVGVNYAEEEQIVAPFIDEFDITFPIVLDLDGRVTDHYFVRSYPVTFFLDAQGILRAQHIGLLTEDVLARYLSTIGLESNN